MPIVNLGEAWSWRRSHRGTGYSTGPIETFEHNFITAFVTAHVGISQVQATTQGPVGAAVGIKNFGPTDFGGDPANWPAVMFGTVSSFTVGSQVTKGDMTVWRYFHVWG